MATFTDSGPPEAASAYKAIINWGKGRKSAGMITGSNGRFVVSARHVFPRFSGTKTVTVTVTDTEGQVGQRERIGIVRRPPSQGDQGDARRRARRSRIADPFELRHR